MKKINWRILLVLSLGHLVTDIFQGALPAILPFLKESLALSYTATGMILLAANVTSSMVQPVFGFISDKRKMAYLLLLGPLAAGIGVSFISVPSAYIPVLMLVIVSGFGIASFHPEGYKTASFFTGEKKVSGMAIFSVGGNLGFAIGPILVLYLIRYFGFKDLPLMVLISLAFAAILLVFWKQITAPAPQGAKSLAEKSKHSLTRGVLFSLSLVIAVVVIRTSIQIGLMSYIPFYFVNYLKGDALYAGKLVFVFLLGGVMGTLFGAPAADRWGHKRFLCLSMLLSSLILPLIFVADGIWLFLVLGILGFVTIATFPVTVVMGQQLLPHHLGIASGLMVGFAIGTGGLWVTLLGVIADHFGVPFALKSIMLLPIMGFLLSLAVHYPEKKEFNPAIIK